MADFDTGEGLSSGFQHRFEVGVEVACEDACDPIARWKLSTPGFLRGECRTGRASSVTSKDVCDVWTSICLGDLLERPTRDASVGRSAAQTEGGSQGDQNAEAEEDLP